MARFSKACCCSGCYSVQGTEIIRPTLGKYFLHSADAAGVVTGFCAMADASPSAVLILAGLGVEIMLTGGGHALSTTSACQRDHDGGYRQSVLAAARSLRFAAYRQHPAHLRHDVIGGRGVDLDDHRVKEPRRGG